MSFEVKSDLLSRRPSLSQYYSPSSSRFRSLRRRLLILWAACGLALLFFTALKKALERGFLVSVVPSYNSWSSQVIASEVPRPSHPAGESITERLGSSLRHKHKAAKPNHYHAQSANVSNVDWSNYAYVLQAHDEISLCSSSMMFARLKELGSQADRVLLHPESWHQYGESEVSRLLLQAKEAFGVKVQPVKLLSRSPLSAPFAKDYFNLIALNQTNYRRVIGLDIDSVMLQNMDSLFLLPSVPVAVPYPSSDSVAQDQISHPLLLVEPKTAKLNRVISDMRSASKHPRAFRRSEMALLSHAKFLPHHHYGLATDEFRTLNGARKHNLPTGSPLRTAEPWDVLRSAKFLHFADGTMPKPWKPISQSMLDHIGPQCVGSRSCTDRDIWLRLYGDFKLRRMEVCGVKDWGGAIKPAALVRTFEGDEHSPKDRGTGVL